MLRPDAAIDDADDDAFARTAAVRTTGDDSTAQLLPQAARGIETEERRRRRCVDRPRFVLLHRKDARHRLQLQHLRITKLSRKAVERVFVAVELAPAADGSERCIVLLRQEVRITCDILAVGVDLRSLARTRGFETTRAAAVERHDRRFGHPHDVSLIVRGLGLCVRSTPCSDSAASITGTPVSTAPSTNASATPRLRMLRFMNPPELKTARVGSVVRKIS